MNQPDNRPKRGLGALLAATTSSDPSNNTPVTSAEVPILSIRPNPAQPRTDFDPVALQELADSIKARGIIQPLVVRPLKPEEAIGDIKYELIAGERRWRASQIAGLDQVPVVIKNIFDERDILLLSLVENLQRDDLNMIEEAHAYDKLAKSFNLTHDQVALGIGKSRAYISNSIRLLELPSSVLDAIKNKQLSPGHGKLLLSVPDPKLQRHLSAKTIAENLTIRELERLTTDTLSVPTTQEPPQPKYSFPITQRKRSRATRLPTAEVQDLERKLREHFGTKVMIEERLRKGRVILEFYSADDLTRIIGLLKMEQ